VSTKVVIVVLVLIGLLFAIILGAGALTRDDDEPIAPSSSFQGIGGLTDERPVNARELGGSSRINVPQGGKFVKKIPKAEGIHVRTLRLTMQQGLQMQINLRPEGDLGIDVSLKLRSEFRKSPKLQVFEKGAILEVSCISAQPMVNMCTLAAQ
jgi:hypothetical protein